MALKAFDFYGYRIFVADVSAIDIANLTRDRLEAMDDASRPKGYFFDGVMWGRADAGSDGRIEYAGQYADSVQSAEGFSYFHHRSGLDERPDFPPSAVVFGRVDAFAWRGDPLRGVFVQRADDDPDPGFDAIMRMFDILYGGAASPERIFASTIARSDADIEWIVTPLEDGGREVTIQAGEDQDWRARMIILYGRGNDEVQSWTLCQRLSSGGALIWGIESRPAAPGTRSLPVETRDLAAVHSDVSGMHHAFLSDLDGNRVGASNRERDTTAAKLDSQRQLMTIGTAVLFFYLLFLLRSKEAT